MSETQQERTQRLINDNAALQRECIRLRKELSDLQAHSYNGHIVKCPKCGENLTSLLLCPVCVVRYKLQEASL